MENISRRDDKLGQSRLRSCVLLRRIPTLISLRLRNLVALLQHTYTEQRCIGRGPPFHI
jgi:hypothetical protein